MKRSRSVLGIVGPLAVASLAGSILAGCDRKEVVVAPTRPVTEPGSVTPPSPPEGGLEGDKGFPRRPLPGTEGSGAAAPATPAPATPAPATPAPAEPAAPATKP
jgi:hypothetical protein